MPAVRMRPHTQRPLFPFLAGVLAVGVIWGGSLSAQQGQNPPNWGTQGQGNQGQGNQGQGGGVVEWPPRRPELPFPRTVDPYYTFPGVESVTPEFRGFPLYAPDSPAFGGYPGLPGFRPEVLRARGDSPTSLLLAPGLARPEGLWPSWLSGGAATTERARADQGLLQRASDRVWFRGHDEEAYVPLPFYDRVRTFEAGAGVQVRSMSGDFTVYLHDNASMQSVGPIHLETTLLNEVTAEFELLDVYYLRLDARKRTVRLRLLDTSVLEVTESIARLERVGNRIVVRNEGLNAILVRSPHGVVEVAQNREVSLLAMPPAEAAPATAFTLQGTVRSRIEARRAELEGGSAGGTVEWLGARIKLRAGAAAMLEAAGGGSFPEFHATRPIGAPRESAPRER